MHDCNALSKRGHGTCTIIYFFFQVLKLFSDETNSFNFMKHLPFVDYKLQDDEKTANTGTTPCQEPLNREDEADSDDEIDSVSKISTIKWSRTETNESGNFDTYN